MANNSNAGWINRAIATGSVSSFVAYTWTHAILPWAVPFGTPFVVALIARAEGKPWAEAIVLALVGFAALSVALLRLDEWRDRRRVEGKLALVEPMWTYRREFPEIGPAAAIKLGFNLASQADFPIEFTVDHVRTNAGSLHNPGPVYNLLGFTVSPRGTAFFWDDEIVIEHPLKDRQVECRIEASVSYGRPGNLRHLQKKKWVLHIAFDKDGLPLQGSLWREAT